MFTSSPPADASTYAHFLFNAFDSAHTGSIKFEVCFIYIRHTNTRVLKNSHSFSLRRSVFSSASGLCDSSVHPAEGLRHREASVDLQPLRHQQGRIHQQRSVCLRMCACFIFIIFPVMVKCTLWLFKLIMFRFSSVLQEMTDIVRAIYDMMGKYTYPVLKTDAPKQHVDAFFQVTTPKCELIEI